MVERGGRTRAASVAGARALPPLALGAFAATGFAPLDWWPVTLGCLAGWLWLVHDSRDLKQALLRGWLFGVGHFTVGNNWIQHAFTFQDAMPHWLGYLAVVLLSAYLAIYPMLAGALAWRFRRAAPDAGYVLIFAAAWIATEWLRGTLFTGYPWNPLGVAWLAAGSIAALATYVGTYALGGVAILAAGAMLLLFRRRWLFAAIVLLPLALLVCFDSNGEWATRWASPANYPHVRIVQPDLAEEERPTDDYAEHNLAAIERMLGRPGPAPRLIVWPEGALRFLVEDGYPPRYYWQGSPRAVRARIARRLGPRDIVLAGGNALAFDAAGEVASATNSIFAIGADARLLGRYDKAHLVPYGEYLPMRPLLSLVGLQRLVPGDTDFTPGPGPRALALPGFGDIGMQICYEIIFSGETVDAAHRPALIFNPSNDSWYGSWGPPQFLAQARLRAIEEGLPILRATPTGISAIIDADGRLLATIPPDTAGAIERPIPPAHPPTLFARAGNLMALATVAAMLSLAVAIRRARR